MSNTIRDVLLNRWNPKHDSVRWMKPAKVALNNILQAHDDVRAQHAAIASDKKLTGLGRQTAMREYVAKNVAPHISHATIAVGKMRARLKQERDRLRPPPPDKADVAAAVVRSEMRGMLRGMANGARNNLLLGSDADPMLWAAILEAPNFASGISDELRQRVTTAAVEKAHPGALAMLEEYEEAVNVINAAREVTFNLARAAGEFPDAHTLRSFIDASLGDRGGRIGEQVEADFRGFGAVEQAA